MANLLTAQDGAARTKQGGPALVGISRETKAGSISVLAEVDARDLSEEQRREGALIWLDLDSVSGQHEGDWNVLEQRDFPPRHEHKVIYFELQLVPGLYRLGLWAGGVLLAARTINVRSKGT